MAHNSPEQHLVLITFSLIAKHYIHTCYTHPYAHIYLFRDKEDFFIITTHPLNDSPSSHDPGKASPVP